MKRFSVIVLSLSVLSAAFADKWPPPEPIASASPSGRFVLRILPGVSQTATKPVAVIFELSSESDHYTKKRAFPLVNRMAPVKACILDTGEVYTFDDWGSMGYDHVAVWYSEDGRAKAELTLAQLFPAKVLAKIKDKHTSVSSINWRDGSPYVNGSDVIVDDVLGGYIMITQGMVSYIPADKK